MLVLDTDICIDLERKHSASLRAVEQLETRSPLAVTVITVQELVQGAYGGPHPSRTVDAVKRLLTAFEILEYDAGAAWIAGRVAAELARDGRMIGDLDVMIAACTIAHDARLVTRNTAHFERVRGLVLEPLG